MKVDDQHSVSRSFTIKHLREAVLARAENTSLRNVAREVGMSPTGLKKFLQGTSPYSPTLRRLRIWYVQYAARSSSGLEYQDARAALTVLMHDLTPEARRSTTHRFISSLARGYDDSGISPPSWIAELNAIDEPAPTPADAGTRPSALGKYRGIIGSSTDYARSKQEAIDLEDRRSDWNTFSTRAR